MGNRSLQLDAEGHPHIAYGGDHLYYARHDGTQWHYEVADGSAGVGEYASLALDGTGHPHISYYDASNGDLKYAWHDGNAWYTKVVDSVGQVGRHTSLALDASGRPHIGYVGSGGEMKYTWREKTTWHIETVNDKEWANGYTSLAVDGSGHPHIIFVGDDSNLLYAWRNKINWHVEFVHDTSYRLVNTNWRSSTSLALDELGRPHIGFTANRLVKYARRGETAWHVTTVDDRGSFWEHNLSVSLALDGAAHPHISLVTGAPESYTLRYARFDGTAWQIERVNNASQVGNYTSLALNGSGQPHISYVESDSGALGHAWQEENAWRTEIVDDGAGKAGLSNSLALDKSGRPRVAYITGHLDSALALKYAWYDGHVWHTETVEDIERNVVKSVALAVDGMGHPHISYTTYRRYERSGESTLKHAWHNGTAWQIETVRIHETIQGISLAIDARGYPHISYTSHGFASEFSFRFHSIHVMHTWYDGNAWQVETVETVGQGASKVTSLALDGMDHPHISYATGHPDAVKYARHDGSSWQIETVDGAGWLSEHGVSLALDGSDHPHLSYVESDDGVLRYAWHNGTAWQVEVVGNVGRIGRSTSLVLDRAGKPHITYLEGYDDALKHAWRDGDAWRIETVTNAAYTAGEPTSLAMDETGCLHVAYYDGTNHDLMYANLTVTP
jgi:hypothetical protein